MSPVPEKACMEPGNLVSYSQYRLQEESALDIHEELELQDCPYCGGAGLLEEENGWCWYVMCMDCGAQTGHVEFRRPEERREAAKKAAYVWNIGKVVRGDIGE